MSFKLFCRISLVFMLSGSVLQGQIPNGAWRDHLSYNEGKRLAATPGRMYCSTASGALFYYQIKDNSLKKISKVDGLSDAGISTIGYSDDMKTLVIGYSNGNIDLVRNDSIYNIPDIKLKTIVGDKVINSFFFHANYAYLACGFGIVLLDLGKREIRDSYLFGPGGSQIEVNDIATDGSNLYAATVSGIYEADMNNPNLVDYNAWVKLQNLPDAGAFFKNLAWHASRLYALYKGSSHDQIIVISGNSWEYWAQSQGENFGFMGEQNGTLIVCGEGLTGVYDAQDNLVREEVTSSARHALTDNDGNIWYAEPYSGLVSVDAEHHGHLYSPPGPAHNTSGDMASGNGSIWIGGGTEATKWNGFGAYSFVDEQWKNYNYTSLPGMSGFLNVSKIAIDPLDNTHVVGGSNGYGIIDFNGGALTGITDETNSILKPVPGYGHGYVNVSGVNMDTEGNLWVSTSLSDQPVYRRNAAGEWEAISLQYKNFGVEQRIGDIMPTSTGQVWLLVQNEGIVVFTADRANDAKEIFFPVTNQVGEALDRVYSIEEDKEGNIWVGTNKGPAEYFNPSAIFDGSAIIAIQPEIPRNDGTNYIDLLLSTEKINSIAVDGANRKWFATEKSGVFLVSEDGKKEIHHFTESNSPLFSNNVLTLTINDKTGEVFFGTDKGILSFKGDATEGGDDFGHVYVYPNPVRETYAGDITITGLARDVNVKVTDISGNLVFETQALGGQAIWNGRNFSGQRVHTGVYLVFCTNDDGSKTHVTKLLFIH